MTLDPFATTLLVAAIFGTGFLFGMIFGFRLMTHASRPMPRPRGPHILPSHAGGLHEDHTSTLCRRTPPAGRARLLPSHSQRATHHNWHWRYHH